MTRQEWLDRADEYDRKAEDAYNRDDERSGEWYEVKAAACRENATLAPEVET